MKIDLKYLYFLFFILDLWEKNDYEDFIFRLRNIEFWFDLILF